MAKILQVPYRSQWDADANKSSADCGPACLAMVLEYYGQRVSINELFSAAGGAPNQYIGFGQLQAAASTYGLSFQYAANCKLNDLKRWVDEGKPAIALVKYSYWSQIEPGVSTQDSFTGPHFVVVVGYGDGNIYINDPNYWPPRREEGHRKAWSEVLFNLAWSNVRTPDAPNPNNAVIVPTVGKPAEEEVSEPPEEKEVRVIEYVVQPGDTWSGLAGKFYGDQSRYPEILAFNKLGPGARLFVGQRLRIPLPAEAPPQQEAPSEERIVLGQGAVQRVTLELVERLKGQLVSAGQLSPDADHAAVLRFFLAQMTSPAAPQDVIEYVVQPGDSWASIAGKFLNDQTRYREIMAFNQLPMGSPLYTGQRLRIPPP